MEFNSKWKTDECEKCGSKYIDTGSAPVIKFGKFNTDERGRHEKMTVTCLVCTYSYEMDTLS